MVVQVYHKDYDKLVARALNIHHEELHIWNWNNCI